MNTKQIAIIAAAATVFAGIIIRRIVTDKANNKACAITAETRIPNDFARCAQTTFSKVYADIDFTVPFQEEWVDTLGEFSGAVKGLHKIPMVNGCFAKSECPFGRKIIFVGTRLGTVALWQLSSTPNGKFGINTTQSVWYANVEGMNGDCYEYVHTILGSADLQRDNIGIALSKIADAPAA